MKHHITIDVTFLHPLYVRRRLLRLRLRPIIKALKHHPRMAYGSLCYLLLRRNWNTNGKTYRHLIMHGTYFSYLSGRLRFPHEINS